MISFKCVIICMTCTSNGESYLQCLCSLSNNIGEADHHLHKEKEIAIECFLTNTWIDIDPPLKTLARQVSIFGGVGASLQC